MQGYSSGLAASAPREVYPVIPHRADAVARHEADMHLAPVSIFHQRDGRIHRKDGCGGHWLVLQCYIGCCGNSGCVRMCPHKCHRFSDMI